MIRFLWNHSNIPSKKSPKYNDVISSTKNFLGKWTWAFGSSTTFAQSYWMMTEDMNIVLTPKTELKWGV